MGLNVFEPIRTTLHGRWIFLAASIPDAGYRADGFDPLEITEATLAVARRILAAGGRILSGGHPTIVPLLFRVAHDLGIRPPGRPVPLLVYQSALYSDLIPSVTRDLEKQRFGTIVTIPAAPGDVPEDGRNGQSLTILRTTMLGPSRDVAAAVFIGGKNGLEQEWQLFRGSFPEALLYPIAPPGGYTARLADSFLDSSYSLHRLLATSRDYGTIADAIVADIAARAQG